MVALELPEAPRVRENVGVFVALPLAMALPVMGAEEDAEGDTQGVAEAQVLGEVLAVTAASRLGEALELELMVLRSRGEGEFVGVEVGAVTEGDAPALALAHWVGDAVPAAAEGVGEKVPVPGGVLEWEGLKSVVLVRAPAVGDKKAVTVTARGGEGVTVPQ